MWTLYGGISGKDERTGLADRLCHSQRSGCHLRPDCQIGWIATAKPACREDFISITQGYETPLAGKISNPNPERQMEKLAEDGVDAVNGRVSLKLYQWRTD